MNVALKSMVTWASCAARFESALPQRAVGALKLIHPRLRDRPYGFSVPVREEGGLVLSAGGERSERVSHI
jgi:hypothetical protein